MVKKLTMALFIGALMLCAQSSTAQDGRGKRIQQLRIAYITDQLDLSVEEAQQFWPLFNAFHDGKKEYEKEIKQGKRSLAEQESISDQDLLDHLDAVPKNHSAILALENNFLIPTLPVLGSKRTLMLMNLEDTFRKRLIEEKFKEKQHKKN